MPTVVSGFGTRGPGFGFLCDSFGFCVFKEEADVRGEKRKREAEDEGEDDEDDD